MSFRATVDGYSGARIYEDAKDFFNTLKNFIDEAGGSETIKFTLFDFGNPKQPMVTILRFLKRNTGWQKPLELAEKLGIKKKTTYNALATLYKRNEIKKTKDPEKGVLYRR